MEKSPSLEKQVIDLKRWMKRKGFNNETKLTLREFPITGRGVSSSRSFQQEQSIIEIPIDLMITYNVVAQSELISYLETPLKIHDLLALYIIYERHKGTQSAWYHYINSLPQELPELPWILNDEEFNTIITSNENILDFITSVKKCRKEYEESITRVEKSIRKTRCFHCEENIDRVFDVNLFTWGYVMVNTRAVHVDPGIISTGRILLDDPSMALCPYLDMFNHSDKANTSVAIDDTEETYKLITLTPYKKHEQIFISYGPHDNNKLLSEYGFFIPFNRYDVFKLSFVQICKRIQFGAKGYKYAKEKGFDKELSVSLEGLSFNLKALLYITISDNQKDWNHTIYTSNYSKSDLREMYSLTLMCVKDFPNGDVKIDDTLLASYFDYLEEFRRVLMDFLCDVIIR